MDNPENTLMELNGFEKSPQTSIPKNLEDYIAFVAKTGNTVFPWPKIKPLMKMKLELIITEFHESLPAEQSIPRMPNVDPFKYSEMKERIFEQLDSYSGVPFTIQRLCELLTQPKRHYKRVDKFMRGLEKVMLVVSTVDPLPVPGGEIGSVIHNGDLARSVEETGESPSKRIRLTSEEEEPGPCDSQDGVQQGNVNNVDSQDKVETNEAGPSNCEPVAPLASPERGGVEESEMDIDTECTSSETRLAQWQQETKPVCDNGVVTTSDSSAAEKMESEDSTEEVTDNCSSSDQDEARVGVGMEDEKEEDSEAEPTEDSREVVNEIEGSRTEETGVVSVQSSEEREETDRTESEPGGAADSSDDVSVSVCDLEEQPSCSFPDDNTSQSVEVGGEPVSSAVEDTKTEAPSEEVSPDQSDGTEQ